MLAYSASDCTNLLAMLQHYCPILVFIKILQRKAGSLVVFLKPFLVSYWVLVYAPYHSDHVFTRARLIPRPRGKHLVRIGL